MLQSEEVGMAARKAWLVCRVVHSSSLARVTLQRFSYENRGDEPSLK